MANFTVVRNAGKSASGMKGCEKHNERENAEYKNADIVKARTELNLQLRRIYKSDGTPETYEQTFKRLLDEGTIVQRGLKPDAKVFGELVFDVNTEYFEQRGGYDFAKKFYEEVYKFAVAEVGSEKYILSAVMHADERNSEASRRLGHDVYHYHLHVIYVPVVTKEILWTKRCKDPELVGKVKEVIPQISHSKKWPMRVPVERDGKTFVVNSYSLLQDRYYNYMKAAGFDDIQRGERGSTAEHLEVLDYKIQQDESRLDDLCLLAEKRETEISALSSEIDKKQEHIVSLGDSVAAKKTKISTLSTAIEKKENQVETLDEALGKKKKQIAVFDKKLSDGKNFSANFAAVHDIGTKKNFIGQIVLTQSELDLVKGFAFEGARGRQKISDLEKALVNTRRERDNWQSKYESLWEEVKDFISAIRKFPERLRDFVTELFRPERERKQALELAREQQVEQQPTKKKSHDRGR